MEGKLTAADINRARNEVETFLSGKKYDAEEINRTLLWLEETLLTYRDNLGEDCSFSLRLGSLLGSKRIRLAVAGERFDPFEQSDEDEISLLRRYIDVLGNRPVWRYSNKKNIVLFSLAKKSLPMWASLLIAIIGALLFGFALRGAPEGFRTVVQTQIFSPVLDTYMGFLTAVACPMIFLSVVCGICGMGDMTTFSAVGKKTVLRFMCNLLASAVLFFIVVPPFYHLNYGSGVSANGYKEMYEMLLDIIPDNLFTPFTAGNNMQMMFLAVVLGITLIVLGKKVEGVTNLLHQCNSIVQMLMGFVTRFIAAYIFLSLTNTISGSDFTMLQVGKGLILGVMCMTALTMLLHTAEVCIRLKISPVQLWKKAGSPTIIALTTASSSAAYPAAVNAQEQQFGVFKKLSDFSISLGHAIYKPSSIGLFFGICISVASASNMVISTGWLIMATLMSLIIAISAPAVPGGWIGCVTLLFTQLGMPMEQMSATLVLAVLLDFPETAGIVFNNQCATLLTAKDVNMIDENTLRAKSVRSK